MSSRILGTALFSAGTVKNDESFQRQSAKGQSGMTGKNGSNGKAISKGYHRHKSTNQKVSKDRNFSGVSARSSMGKAISKGYFKGSNGNGFKGTVGKSFEGVGKTRSTADDARQSAMVCRWLMSHSFVS